MDQHQTYMRRTFELARQNIVQGGGPFAALIVKEDHVIGIGTNQVTPSNDPTAHAEIVAIRDACKKLADFSLEGCTLYSSCEPCPMCLSAIYWARISTLFFGASHQEAGEAGFRDDFIYKELRLPIQQRAITTTRILREEAQSPFTLWHDLESKTEY